MYYRISKKVKYALRALIELSLHSDEKPLGVRKLAQIQEIPQRFLEIILHELRQGGFVVSVRGKYGGFLLSRDPQLIPVGEVICFLENGTGEHKVQKSGFSEQWLLDRVDRAIANIFDATTLQDMVLQEQKNRGAYTSNYVI